MDPELITDPPMSELISSDSLSAGSHLGLGIGTEAIKIYEAIQGLKASQGVSYVNVVGNTSSDLESLVQRLPLYQYILLDEQKGTDTGVQLTLAEGRIAHIYLNNGVKLSQWPANQNGESAVRMGDKAEELYQKLVNIHSIKGYASKFERIMLLTKNLSTAYDPAMAGSSQWYFAYAPAPNLIEEVKINFDNGLVSAIVVNRYQ
ncbi:hypothetical protein CLV98_101397 [Dyadobacter jejuensis]|uniref:Uncharacterized protein n=2 Tax=Dyadobacter jejuensis TaxID=1082580 RepID=A0A316ASA2_9BACT|nr:hypothetical protein CLV98_101397 [Dyadobacter jejuensis]